MAYTRKFLNKIRHSQSGRAVIQELVNKLSNKDELTLAEEEVACSITKILRNENGDYMFDITEIEGCNNYRFRGTYLLYANDLDGIGNIIDFLGPIPAKRKGDDVKFLDNEYKHWKQIVTGKKNNDAFLNYLIDETVHQIKMMEKHCVKENLPATRKEYLEKSIVLHSKYIFLLVKEFYQDNIDEQFVVDFYGHKVLIDQFCYIHTMFRHFAATVKDYQQDKSYHFDQSVLYQDLPLFLKRFVLIFLRNCRRSEFNGRSIDLVFKGRKYSLWFRPFTMHKAGAATTFLRLQTFYPIETLKDRIRVQGLRREKINGKLTLLVKHEY